ncbi:hypothetical protein EIP86_006136 [Pleurotus ostreatoroseus]|nr:hypothetical protein EIP86_006136 [Pleurotus ostreatoroseus]
MPVPLLKETNVDVLIIGAGPAGLIPTGVAAGQADGIQPRTIEVLQAFYNPGSDGGIERTARVRNIDAPTARYPFAVTLHQGAIEQIFVDSLKSLGVTVDRPMVPVSIQLSEDSAELADPQSYPVKVVLKRLDALEGQTDTEIVHAKFVLGADGAHSWVRKSFDITMDGEQTDYVWGVVDIIPETDFPDIRNKTAIHSNNGSCMIIPREGDKVRLYIQITDKATIDPANWRTDKAKMGPEKILQVAKKTFYPYTISAKSFDWWTIYGIGQRVASKFSIKERVFIAGDACHTHSPKAGQGMNASMNDTHNLVWKLAYVLRGWADLSLLKTYEFERRKYAQDLISFDKEFSALFSGKPLTKDNLDGVSHETFLQAFQGYGAFTSGIAVHYSPSAITNPTRQRLASGLIVGQRLPPQIFIRAADARPCEMQDLLPSDTRFKILVFVGNTANSAQMQRVIAFAAQFDREDGFFRKFGKPEPTKVFDVLAISSATKEQLNFTDLPPVLRPRWSNVLLDDTDMYGRVGGHGYETYGLDPTSGAIVIVRPDGYIGMITALDEVDTIDQYFGSFMRS